MDILTPLRPASRYGPPTKFGTHPEGGGFVATCQCGHVRWHADQKTATTGYAAHVKGCKSHKAVGE